MRKSDKWIGIAVGLVLGGALVASGIMQPIIPQLVPVANKRGTSNVFQLALNNSAAAAGTAFCDDGSGNVTTVGCSGGGGGAAGATLFSSTANAGPSNSAAETSLIGTVVGSKTIPGATFTNGAVLEARSQGFFSLPAVSDSLTLKAKCGSTVIGSATLTPGAGLLTNGTFRFWLMITARGTGAGGAFSTNGIILMSGSALIPTVTKVLNASPVAFDFTTSCVFDMTAQWGAAQVGELMTGTEAAAWIPGAPVINVAGLVGAIAGEGNGTKVQLFTGADPATDDCAKFDVNHNLVTAGAACGAGGGSVTTAPPYVTISGATFGPLLAVTTPPSTGWTQINFGGTSVSSVNGSYAFAWDNGGTNIRGLQRALPAASNYTVTACQYGTQTAASLGNLGFGLQNSGTTALVFAYFVVNSGTGFTYQTWGNPTGSGIGNYVSSFPFDPYPMVCLRFKDDGANRILSVSPDGVTFAQVDSHARTDFVTPDSVLVGIETPGTSNVGISTFISYTATTP